MTETQVSYSQYKEDLVILSIAKETGRFLDIGAWHPTQFSNTRALYERGWGGVMIEPSPGPFLSLLREYGNDPRITLICAAVGFHHGLAELWATDDAVSTTETAQHEIWKEAGGYYGKFLTPVITMGDIINRFGAFDFVNIDTEGTSVDVLHALLKVVKPQIICVEHDNRSVEAEVAAQEAGYRVALVNSCNLVFAL